jgi:hypothetical protein
MSDLISVATSVSEYSNLRESDKFGIISVKSYGAIGDGTTDDLIENYLTSEFCFCPRGNGNFSIRFYETLYYGRIPVIIDSDIMLPFENLIEWNKYIVISKTIEELPEKIYNFWLNNDICEAQLNCKKLYNEYFSQNNISEKILEELLFNKLIN